jgi:hypothetical protein
LNCKYLNLRWPSSLAFPNLMPFGSWALGVNAK